MIRVADTTSDNGPNGSEDWINCGIHEPGGWNPPPVKLDDLHIVDFEDALKDSKSPFHACSGEIKDAIRSVAQDKKVPATLIASVIMQESSCKPETTGAGGEQGLMQITKDKCDLGVNCKEIHYNIARGTDFLLQLLAQFDYHILAVLGNYNGWHLGLTFEDAIKAQHSDCCLCMNNLDYPFQYVNGWLRNKDPYVLRLGKYHNLEWC
ncbi:glycoside hydrolase family 23 protein [Abortiporus biennis]|nr:glycoside hydrolase family 23 protein [Abortiporus biennis]